MWKAGAYKIAWATIVFASILGCSSEVHKPIRIVLLTLDTLRYDSLVNTGDMPSTLELAQRSRMFRRHYAATSTTQPTHSSLFTGLHPWEHRVTANGSVLADEFRTLAERLKESGYQTAGVVASFVLQRRFGFAQGFDVYRDDMLELGLPGEGPTLDGHGLLFNKAEVITERALSIFDELTGSKQFIWLHYFDAHNPYGDSGGPDPILHKTIADKLRAGQRVDDLLMRARRNYDFDVRTLDGFLNQIYQRLESDAHEVESHLVIVSDHGESFGEELAFGHGRRLSEEQIRVPLLIHSPLAEPGVVDIPTGTIDVATTILALAGLEDPQGRGRNLLQLDEIEGGVFGMRRTFAEPKFEIRTDTSTRELAVYEFYAIHGETIVRGDRNELSTSSSANLGEDEEARLKAAFAVFQDTLTNGTAVEGLDRDTLRALESLGYER